MKYAVQMGSGAMTYISSFTRLVKVLHRHTEREKWHKLILRK
jgi:hypothetical protein